MLLKQCNDSLFYCFVGKQIWEKKDFSKEKIKHFRTIYSNVNVDPNIQSKVGFKKTQITQGIVYLIFV